MGYPHDRFITDPIIRRYTLLILTASQNYLSMALQSFAGHWRFSTFLILYTVGLRSLPSNGRSLHNHYLAKGYDITVYLTVTAMHPKRRVLRREYTEQSNSFHGYTFLWCLK